MLDEKNAGFKYCLIVSQFYHDRHCFIVDVANLNEEQFLTKARGLVKELEEYKRSPEYYNHVNGVDLGDLAEIYVHSVEGGIRADINVNDAGDIYFRLRKYANRCMYEAMEYRETSIRESKGYKAKDVLRRIQDHHQHQHIKEIIERYFDIA